MPVLKKLSDPTVRSKNKKPNGRKLIGKWIWQLHRSINIVSTCPVQNSFSCVTDTEIRPSGNRRKSVTNPVRFSGGTVIWALPWTVHIGGSKIRVFIFSIERSQGLEEVSLQLVLLPYAVKFLAELFLLTLRVAQLPDSFDSSRRFFITCLSTAVLHFVCQ